MNGHLDPRFSATAAQPTPWEAVEEILETAELFWLTTVRRDGRPHATPLVAVRVDGAVHFATGLDEQKARNLEANPEVVLITGANAWAAGTDVVVEGVAERRDDRETLERVAAAFFAKYGEDWRYEVGDGVVSHSPGHAAAIFRVNTRKVLAFAKDPHAQTTYRPL